MKNMRSGETGKADGSGGAGRNGSGGGEGGSGSGEIPPGLMEALGEALNDDEFKRTLEQIGKQLGKDQGQVCVCMRKVDKTMVRRLIVCFADGDVLLL